MTLASDMQILSGFLGGLLIGVSALLLMLGNGKTAGISGIVGLAISRPRYSGWRWVFIGGLLCGSAAFLMLNGSLDAVFPPFDSHTFLAAALVGVGTRLGSGCTSGHGVCGVGRRCIRSFTAVARQASWSINSKEVGYQCRVIGEGLKSNCRGLETNRSKIKAIEKLSTATLGLNT